MSALDLSSVRYVAPVFQPLAVDLFCGLGGWTEGLLTEGYDVVGFDNERHVYGEHRYPAQLVLQDVRTLHGSQFKDAALIVASPPCQEYSYMAMPWSRAKQIAREYRDGTRDVKQLTELFDACFRIQREASAAAGHHVPMVVENVKGAQPWAGKARWHFGSYYLWGDVPALMPVPMKAQKFNPDGTAHGVGSWFAVADSKNRGASATKNTGGSWFAVSHNTGTPNNARDALVREMSSGVKQAGIAGLRENGKGDRWFQDGAASHGSKSSARRAASARIAKIPLTLARHIAHVYKPAECV